MKLTRIWAKLSVCSITPTVNFLIGKSAREDMDTTLEGKIHGHPTLADGTLIAEKDIAKPAEETLTYKPTTYGFGSR